jgi:hypothetical protein
MQFADEAERISRLLQNIGHKTHVSHWNNQFLGKSDDEKQSLKLQVKNNFDAISEHWNKIKESDAILVLNFDKKGIRNYIGANTFLEMGFAHVLGKKIFLMNPLPDDSFHRSEIEVMRPAILNGDLAQIR